MSDLDRFAFNVLKKRIASQAQKDRRKGDAKKVEVLEFGKTASLTVVDSFETQIPGSIIGSSEQQETVSIAAGTVVDDEVGTRDIIEFSHGEYHFRATERPWSGHSNLLWQLESLD